MADVFTVLGLTRGDIELAGRDTCTASDDDMKHIARRFGLWVSNAIDFYEILGEFLDDQEGHLPIENMKHGTSPCGSAMTRISTRWRNGGRSE